MVLFKTATDLLTLSFVHRREHKRDSNRDVLGHVSLIREIDPIKPHRAHLDILSDLSLPQRLQWMNAHDKPHNFDGLLAAWLNALDTEALNRRFYGDLFGWFERAIREATFPSSRQKRMLPPEEHIIRLITRLMFVWFIKEKRLIADGSVHRGANRQFAEKLRPRRGRFVLSRCVAKSVFRHPEHRDRQTRF